MTGSWLTGVVYRWSPKRTLDGIPVAVLFLSSAEERRVIFDKIAAALSLVREHSPVRYGQICQDLKCMLVCGDASTAARYVADLQMCELFFKYVLSSDTAVTDVASTLVHEAQHARLWRLGFGYDEAQRARIERVCYKAERSFGLRLPSGATVVAAAARGMSADPASFSEVAHAQAQVRALDELDLPKWFAALASFWMRRRTREARARVERGSRAAQR